MGRTGEIEEIIKCSFKWNIQYFFSLHLHHTFHDSPDFEFGNETWCIRIYPNGQYINSTSGYIGLFLVKKSARSASHAVTCKLSLKDENGEDYQHGTFTYDFVKEVTTGFPKFLERHQLLKDREILVPKSILTIYCTFSSSVSVTKDKKQTTVFNIDKCPDRKREVQVEEKGLNGKDAFRIPKGIEKATQDFKNLLLSEEDSDVTLKVKDRLFRVHRLILKARSPVFYSMFQNSRAETPTGIVDITDCNPSVFHDFLLCLYSGSMKKMNVSNVLSLYSIADKYDVDVIKAECVEFIEKELSVDTVCDVIALALLHKELALMESATLFFTKYVKEIILTVQWRTFLKENFDAANELYIKALDNFVPK